MTEHEHRWHQIAHFDGCHFEERHYVCTIKGCAAHRRTYRERDVASEPFGLAFLREDCPRCCWLAGGEREPINILTDIIEGRGTDGH